MISGELEVNWFAQIILKKNLISIHYEYSDALHDLVSFMQFKKCEKTPMEECYF